MRIYTFCVCAHRFIDNVYKMIYNECRERNVCIWRDVLWQIQ